MVNLMTILLAGGTSQFPGWRVSAHHLSTSKNEHGKHSNAECISSLATLQDYDIRDNAEGTQPLGFDSCTDHWLTRLIDGLNVEALYIVRKGPCYVQPAWSDAH